MAEALLNAHGAGRFHAFSAGSQPSGRPNPFALEKVRQLGFASELVRSKSWEEFAGPDAPKLDFVITVCDNAAGEVCPIWPGRPATAHWGFPDPSATHGDDDAKRAAFSASLSAIEQHIRALVALPVESLDPAALRAALQRIASNTSP